MNEAELIRSVAILKQSMKALIRIVMDDVVAYDRDQLLGDLMELDTKLDAIPLKG